MRPLAATSCALLLLSLAGCDAGPGGGEEPPVQYSPPSAMTVMITPPAPSSSETFIVQVVEPPVDPDGDLAASRYTWWVDGVLQVDLTDAAAIGAEWTRRGEVWEVRAYAYDSLGLMGPETSAQVTIGNSAPLAPSLSHSPESPAPGADPIQCVIEEEAVDVDGDALSYTFRWTVNGLPYPESDALWVGPETTTLEGDTIPSEDTAPQQHWVCSVRASDGLAEGDEASVEVTVGETPAQEDFSLLDVNQTSPSFGSEVSPRDYLEKVSGWYFGHAT